MGEEVEIVAKSAGEVAGAVADALIEKSSAAEPLRARMEALTARIHYRYYPQTVRQALKAARRIEEAGLPRRAIEAVPDPLLRAILEGGAMAEDETMHDRWANLLANALSDGPVPVLTSFTRILSDLEPLEAMLLDKLCDGSLPPPSVGEGEEIPDEEAGEWPPWVNWLELSFDRCQELGVTRLNIYNLRRLSLVWAAADLMTADVPSEVGLAGFASDPNDHSVPLLLTTTELGWALVQTCQAPEPPT